MAYIDRHAPQNRGPILVAIAVIHVGLAYALVTGLVAKILPSDKTELAGYQIDLPKTPPPKPVPQPTTTPRDFAASSTAAAAESTSTATETTFDLSGSARAAGGEGGAGDILPPLDPIIPTSDPTPIFTPKAARPIGRPGLWITPGDYPTNDLRAGHEGTTRFLLSIGADGRVQSCEVTVSSGFPGLDAATCNNLKKRGKFAGATDSNGAAAPGTYSSAVRWTIPKE